MRASINLKHLRHLELLAEELNFSRAAERANLSQTAFSRSIQALETEFGLRYLIETHDLYVQLQRVDI